MAQTAVRTVNSAKPPLGKYDWLAASLSMLVDEGVEAVQITRLARKLKVSRGSFYWHFKDRDDLLKAVLAEWRAANSGVMASGLATATSLTEGVLSLFSIWVEDEQFSTRFDQAIHDWARRSDQVMQIVRLEEDKRIQAIAAFFCKHGYDDIEAFVRARVLYFTQAGYYALNIEESMTARLELLDTYYKAFTGAEIDASEASAFKSRMNRRSTS